MSLFDVKQGVKLMEGSQSVLPPQRALPTAHEAVLQLGQMRFKLLPDLTRACPLALPAPAARKKTHKMRALTRAAASPRAASRALIWGTLLAVWTIAGVTVKTARMMDIGSVRSASKSPLHRTCAHRRVRCSRSAAVAHARLRT